MIAISEIPEVPNFTATISMLRDFVQILFWVVAGVVAVLSYRQAKKTIFQPAKNEVFKVQVGELQKLLAELNWKSSLDAWSVSGVEEAALLNLHDSFKSYAQNRFATKIQRASDDKVRAVGALVSPSASGFRLIKGPADTSPEENVSTADTKISEQAWWDNYKWDLFSYGPKLHRTREFLDHASGNPVLPENVITKVKKLRTALTQCSIAAANDVQTAVRQFPRHYASKESLSGADLTWAENVRIELGENLFEAHQSLKQEIRTYLQTDTLFAS